MKREEGGDWGEKRGGEPLLYVVGGSAAKVASASVACPCANGDWYVRVSSCVSALCEAVLSRPVREWDERIPCAV